MPLSVGWQGKKCSRRPGSLDGQPAFKGGVDPWGLSFGPPAGCVQRVPSSCPTASWHRPSHSEFSTIAGGRLFPTRKNGIELLRPRLSTESLPRRRTRHLKDQQLERFDKTILPHLAA